ncbi:MAG: tetratricopeptide repeat protein, partial [Oligoflexales bacterium]|nr:tetratricopeptide repeat protein [Oligoflexales bacterium]
IFPRGVTSAVPEKSVEKMSILCQETPEKPDMKFDMVSKLEEKGFSQHAIQFCRSTSTAVEVVRHYNNKGVLDSKNGNHDKAIKSYQEAVQFFPDHEESYKIHWNLAIALINNKSEGYLEKSASALEQALKLKPDFEKAKHLLEKVKSGKKVVLSDETAATIGENKNAS